MRSRTILGLAKLLAATAGAGGRTKGVAGLAIGTTTTTTTTTTYHRFRSTRSLRCSTMPGEDDDDDNDDETDRFVGNLREWNHSELLEYCHQMKQILLDVYECEYDDKDDDDDDGVGEIPVFPLRTLESRHRKSMVRCVLNQFHSCGTDTDTDTGSSNKISRVEFKERLRLVERRRRWKLTRTLLFGEEEGGLQTGQRYWWEREDVVQKAAPGFLERIQDYRSELNECELSRNDSSAAAAATNESPRSKRSDATVATEQQQQQQQQQQRQGNPKKFLSRLASGRFYKGDFRALLEDCLSDDATVTARNSNAKTVTRKSTNGGDTVVALPPSDCLSLYEEIGRDKMAGSSSDPDHELELLRCFIDELENDYKLENDDGDGDGDGDDECLDNGEQHSGTERETNNHSNSKNNNNNINHHHHTLPRITVTKEQLVLLRAVCDLKVGEPPVSSSSSSPPPLSPFTISAMGDGGRALGKRGERDLTTYLLEQHAAIDIAGMDIAGAFEAKVEFESTKHSPPVAPPPWLLSPVWVRPRSKNRRNRKDKCRCVLEIPKASTGNYAALGTTSEYDAMVVVPSKSNNHNSNSNSDTEPEPEDPSTGLEAAASLPVLSIAEVWEAKATLDPSSLLDVLEKKVLSLQSLLLDEESKVVRPGEQQRSNRGCDTTNTTTTTDEEGAKFVLLLPCSSSGDTEDENDATTTCESTGSSLLSPRVYRVGVVDIDVDVDIESTTTGWEDRRTLPSIGIFASRMLSPRTGARRIATVVGERLLETDLETVRSVLGVVTVDGDNDNDGNGNGNGNGDVDRRARARTAGLVRHESVAIVERILRLVTAFRPRVVVGTLGDSKQHHGFVCSTGAQAKR